MLPQDPPTDGQVMKHPEFRWCVEEIDTGLPVASGCAPAAEEAHTEMLRYAIQYAKDGPVRYWIRHNRKTISAGQVNLSGKP